MHGDKDRADETSTSTDGRGLALVQTEDVSLMSGEALDDDKLDELCDAMIGDLSGR